MSLLDGINAQYAVSDRVPMPVDVLGDTSYLNDVSAETVQFYYFSNALLTCGTEGTSTPATWAALAATSSFQIDFNGKTYVVTPDFTGDASMAHVAASIQTALRAKGGALAAVTCAYSTDHLIITTVKDESGADMANSISVLSNPHSNTGTDIAGANFMNGLYGVGVITPATLTTDAGEAAGTIVVGKTLYSGVLDTIGAMIGNSTDISLVWTTDTVLPKKYIQPFAKDHIENVGHTTIMDIAYSMGRTLTVNGEWGIDPRSGLIVGRKATTGVSDAAAYKVQTQATGGGTSIAASVNVAKIAGTVVATGAGAVSAGVQRMTLSSDDPAVTLLGTIDTDTGAMVTALQIMDDWDATEDAAIGADGAVIICKARDSQQTAMSANDDAVIPVTTLYGEQVIAGYNWSTQKVGTSESDPLDEHYSNGSVDIDTTNVSAATHYYPSATGGTMDGFKDQSLSGKFIDADGTLTLTLQVSNDEDSTNADWNDAYFYDDELNATVATKTVTNGTELFTLSCNNNNFRRYRWVVVASGATNTVILKERKKAL